MSTPCGHLILCINKVARNAHWKNDSIFNKLFWLNYMATCGKMHIDPYFSSCTEFNYKCIKELTIKSDTLNPIEEKWEDHLELIGQGEDYLNRNRNSCQQLINVTS